MTFMLAFMGLLALLSGYVVSLEARLQRDGLFCPFSLRENLRAAPGARKVLAWCGVALWVVAAISYVCMPTDEPMPTSVVLKGLSAVLLVYGFMGIGYARQAEFGKTGRSANAIPHLAGLAPYEKRWVAYKAALAMGRILVFFAALAALRWAMWSWR